MTRVEQEVVECLEGLEELQRECEDYAVAARAEREARARLFDQVKPLLARLRRPVNLDLDMEGLFPRAVKLAMGPDFSLKVTYARGRVESVPLLSLEDAFVKVMKSVVTRLEEEAEKRRKGENARSRPRLKAELRVSKRRLPIFGRWRYNLVVFNLGGDALSVAVTTKYGEKERLFEGFDIPKGKTVSCELQGDEGELREEKIGVDVLCSDVMGSPYLGSTQLPGSGGGRIIRLRGYRPDDDGCRHFDDGATDRSRS